MKNARHLTQLAAATRKLRVRLCLCLTIISAFMCVYVHTKRFAFFIKHALFFKVISLYDICTRQLWPTFAPAYASNVLIFR